jgi:hypothetical protein
MWSTPAKSAEIKRDSCWEPIGIGGRRVAGRFHRELLLTKAELAEKREEAAGMDGGWIWR